MQEQITEAQLRRLRGLRARAGSRRRAMLRRRGVAAGILLLIGIGAVTMLRGGDSRPPAPQDIEGSPSWAREHYGNPDAPGFKARNIVSIDFLGRTMYVHKAAQRHFLRLERLFEARAPEYAAAVAVGTLDDWSYENRDVVGEVDNKSNHAFGLAIDVNALTNVLGTTGDIPVEVVEQWEAEGGDWGGDWSRPDPMHFETHLTPEQIRERYHLDGTPKDWYLQELVGG